jgi:hypothetical protein
MTATVMFDAAGVVPVDAAGVGVPVPVLGAAVGAVVALELEQASAIIAKTTTRPARRDLISLPPVS